MGMVQIAVFSVIALFVLFFGFLLYRALRTVKKLRNPSSGPTGSAMLMPDEKTLAIAAKMGGISVAEARSRLGALESADSKTVEKVSKALGNVSSGDNSSFTATRKASQASSRNYAKDSKTKKKRKAANKSRAINRNKRNK